MPWNQTLNYTHVWLVPLFFQINILRCNKNIIIPCTSGPATLPSRSAAAVATPAAVPSSSTKSSSFSSPKANAAVVVQEVEAPLKKKQDLSGVAPAAKKRRALAACKKPDTRKFARAGSEAKCTESVMKGDYDNIIEALEYGR